MFVKYFKTIYIYIYIYIYILAKSITAPNGANNSGLDWKKKVKLSKASCNLQPKLEDNPVVKWIFTQWKNQAGWPFNSPTLKLSQKRTQHYVMAKFLMATNSSCPRDFSAIGEAKIALLTFLKK